MQIMIRLVGLALGIYSGVGLAMGTVWATSVPVLFVAGTIASLFNMLSFAFPARLLEIRSVRVAMTALAVVVLIGLLVCVAAGDNSFLRIQLLDVAVPIIFLVWTSTFLRLT
jgi:hypothetical protein